MREFWPTAIETFITGFVLATLVSVQLRLFILKSNNGLFFAVSFALNAFWGFAVHLIAKDPIMIVIYALATATAMTIGKNLPLDRIEKLFARFKKAGQK